MRRKPGLINRIALPVSHTHTESDITDLGSYSVTGHTHTESDIIDLGAYLTDAPSDGSQYIRKDAAWSILSSGAEVNDLSSIVTWANVPNANITEASVTQHEAALAILETQITDGSVLTRLAANEVITGNWSFDGASNVLDLTNGCDARLESNDGTTFVSLNHNNTDFRFSVTGTRFNSIPCVLDGFSTMRSGQPFEIQEQTAAASSTSQWGQLWVKTATPNELWFTNDAGTDFQLGVGAPVGHSHAAGDTTSGTFANARVSQASVTQHQAALTILESQITNAGLLARVGDAESITGAWEWQDNVSLRFGTSNDARIYHNASNTFIDLTGASNSFRVRVNGTEDGLSIAPNGALTAFYNGVSELRTQDSDGTDSITGAEVKHWDGSFYDVGMARMPRVNFSSATIVSDTHWHKRLVHNGTAGVSLQVTFNTETTQPNDVVLWVMALNGEVVLVDGTMVLHHFSGSGGAPATGNITIARGGWATVIKDGDSSGHVTGVGLS